MFNIKIITIGKIKEESYKTLIKEYLKRLSPYARINIVELDSKSFKKDSEIDKVKKDEGEKFLKAISNNIDSIIIALDENGDELTSYKFADYLDVQNREIIFLIAGTVGFSKEVKLRVNKLFSLSQMTLPHEMARVVLLEQIYRSATIINNKKYHY